MPQTLRHRSGVVESLRPSRNAVQGDFLFEHAAFGTATA